MQTWTVVRFLHILAIVFFVGGQLMLVAAVAPALRREGEHESMRSIARRFGLGRHRRAGGAVRNRVAMASHFSLWSSPILQLKLMVLVLVGVLTVLACSPPGVGPSPTRSPRHRSLSSGSA